MTGLREDCKLVFCVGVGGVGKTTFAAALGLREALLGRSVLVLTADPAKRLADALGMYGLRDDPSTISLPEGAKGGELHAAMLETKTSADAIIRRAAQSETRAQRVLDNKIYQAFSNTLARSHAYAAMERVHEAIRDPRYELVIVDTPPAQSAIEILEAPARLVRFLDQRVVRWFLQPVDGSTRLRGGALARRLLTTIAGESLVAALTDFLGEMAFLREGFSERARDVRDTMRSSDTEFILVSSADSVGVEAARSVADEVVRRGFVLGHIVFNRAFISGVDVTDVTDVGDGGYPSALAELAPTLERMRAWFADEQARKRVVIEKFCREQGRGAWILPEATKPLGSRLALSAWISAGRSIQPPA
ncbi:MAG: AAA family ATPase [Myxococcales bacterium]|nr:AAA family ATPase [Myxococcales bacterium]